MTVSVHHHCLFLCIETFDRKSELLFIITFKTYNHSPWPADQFLLNSVLFIAKTNSFTSEIEEKNQVRSILIQ